MEANESELERTLEDVKMKYQSCHEAYLIFEQSHGALEKNASSGSIDKLNRCDEDVENGKESSGGQETGGGRWGCRKKGKGCGGQNDTVRGSQRSDAGVVGWY